MGRGFFLSVINRCDIRIRIGGLVDRIRQQRNARLVIRIRAQRGIDSRKTNRGLEIENRTCLSITLLGRTPPPRGYSARKSSPRNFRRTQDCRHMPYNLPETIPTPARRSTLLPWFFEKTRASPGSKNRQLYRIRKRYINNPKNPFYILALLCFSSTQKQYLIH